MAFHVPTSLKASMFLSAARAHQSSAVAFFTWKAVTLPPSRCKVLSPSNTDQIWAPYFIKHFQRTPQDNNIFLRDGVRIIHQEVALFITSTSNDIEAHFPRQHHVTQTQHAPLRPVYVTHRGHVFQEGNMKVDWDATGHPKLQCFIFHPAVTAHVGHVPSGVGAYTNSTRKPQSGRLSEYKCWLSKQACQRHPATKDRKLIAQVLVLCTWF